jgi:hypothetical protein
MRLKDEDDQTASLPHDAPRISEQFLVPEMNSIKIANQDCGGTSHKSEKYAFLSSTPSSYGNSP